MAKLLKDLLEEIEFEKLDEAGEENLGQEPKEPTNDDTDDDEGEDEDKLENHLHDGKGHYSPNDLIEICKYVETLIEKELEDEDSNGEKKGDSDVGEIGLDLIISYADLLPETVINQIVSDLQKIFEIDDTMLESVIEEGSAFFTKSKKGPAAKAAKNLMNDMYKKNKGKIKKRNEKWATSDTFKKVADFHKKCFKGLGKMKGKRLHPEVA